MIEQARNPHALFLAAAKYVFPHFLRIPAALAVGDVSELSFLENLGEFKVATPSVFHVNGGVWVDDLVAEGTSGEVRALRKEHDAVDAVGAGPRDEAAVGGPEACDDAGDGAFADAVGARDEEVLARVDNEGEGFDEVVATHGVEGGGDDGYVLETDAVEAFVYCALHV
jgi:hypothetical protein